MYKKIKMIFSIVMLILSIGCLSGESRGEEERLDVIFVIDDTGSMKVNDREMLSAKALRQFIDILPAGGDQVGVLTHSHEVMERINPVILDDGGEQKERIKEFSINNIRQDGQKTDIAAGLLAAVNMLEASARTGCKQLIILVSDGENDFAGVRTQQQSDTDLAYALAANYPVYTIGLKPPSEEYRQYLSNIAESTGGLSYFPTNNEELPDIFKGILYQTSDLQVSDGELIINEAEVAEYIIEIPREVYEVNIQITHQDYIDAVLEDEDGQPIDFSNPKYAVWNQEKEYTNIKLIQPACGILTLKVKSSINETIRIDTIYNHQLYVSVQAVEPISTEEPVRFIAKLCYGGTDNIIEAITQRELKGVLMISSETDSSTYSMDITDSTFAVEVQLKPGSYVYQAALSGGSLELVSIDHDLLIPASELPSDIPSEVSDPGLSGNDHEEQDASWFRIVIKVVGGIVAFALLVIISIILKKYLIGQPLRGSLTINRKGRGQLKWNLSIPINHYGKSVSLGTLVLKLNRTSENLDELKKVYFYAGRNREEIRIKNKGNCVLEDEYASVGNEFTVYVTEDEKYGIIFKL